MRFVCGRLFVLFLSSIFLTSNASALMLSGNRADYESFVFNRGSNIVISSSCLINASLSRQGLSLENLSELVVFNTTNLPVGIYELKASDCGGSIDQDIYLIFEAGNSSLLSDKVYFPQALRGYNSFKGEIILRIINKSFNYDFSYFIKHFALNEFDYYEIHPRSNTIFLEAIKVIDGSASRSDAAKRIVNYLNNRLYYSFLGFMFPSSIFGISNTDLAILNHGYGICVDYATLTISFLRSVGIPTRRVTEVAIKRDYIAPSINWLSNFKYHVLAEFLGENNSWRSADSQVACIDCIDNSAEIYRS